MKNSEGSDYTTGCLLDYVYFKIYRKMIAIYFSKQIALAMQQISFTGNLDQAGNTTIFFIIKEAQESLLDFSRRTVRVL